MKKKVTRINLLEKAKKAREIFIVTNFFPVTVYDL